MPPRTDDDLKQLARDIVAGRVFTDLHIQAPATEVKLDIMRAVWPILLFMNEQQQAEINALHPVMIYEYLREAGPRSVNGYPVFFSLHVIGQEEWTRLSVYLDRLYDAPDPLDDSGTSR